MKKRNFLSKFVVACVGIFLFGASMQTAFCIDNTNTTNIAGETFIDSNVEYKIITAFTDQGIGNVCVVRFCDKSVVFSKNLEVTVGEYGYSYIVSKTELNENSIDIEYLYFTDSKTKDLDKSLAVLENIDLAALKAIYVTTESCASVVKEHFKDIPVYVVPSESKEATDLGTKELNFDKDNNKVVLSWDEIPGANNYVITKSEIDTDEIIDVIISENDYETEDENSKRQYNYVDSDLVAGKTYQYKITAYAGSGQKDDLFKTELAFFTTDAVSVPEKSTVNNKKPGNSSNNIPSYSTNINNNLDSENNVINNSQNQDNVSDNTEINYDNLSENNKVNNKLESYKTGDNSHVVLFFCFANFILFCVFVITRKKRI